jgi:hypothetical protein
MLPPAITPVAEGGVHSEASQRYDLNISQLTVSIYALCRRSRKIAMILAASFVIEHALITTFTIRTFPSVVYNNVCFAVEVAPTVIGIGSVSTIHVWANPGSFSLQVSTYIVRSIPPCSHPLQMCSNRATTLAPDTVHLGPCPRWSWAFATVFGQHPLSRILTRAQPGVLRLDSLLLAVIDNPLRLCRLSACSFFILFYLHSFLFHSTGRCHGNLLRVPSQHAASHYILVVLFARCK